MSGRNHAGSRREDNGGMADYARLEARSGTAVTGNGPIVLPYRFYDARYGTVICPECARTVKLTRSSRLGSHLAPLADDECELAGRVVMLIPERRV